MKYVGNYVERSESKVDGDLTINVGLVDDEKEYFKVNVYIYKKIFELSVLPTNGKSAVETFPQPKEVGSNFLLNLAKRISP